MLTKNKLNPHYKLTLAIASMSVLSSYVISYGNIMFKKFRLGHYET